MLHFTSILGVRGLHDSDVVASIVVASFQGATVIACHAMTVGVHFILHASNFLLRHGVIA
jgi:hypothetical protein